MSDTASGGGIGLSGVLLVVFIVLKLCHVIDWSWWWVLAPFWMPILLAILVFLVLGTIAAVLKAFTPKRGSGKGLTRN